MDALGALAFLRKLAHLELKFMGCRGLRSIEACTNGLTVRKDARSIASCVLDFTGCLGLRSAAQTSVPSVECPTLDDFVKVAAPISPHTKSVRNSSPLKQTKTM